MTEEDACNGFHFDPRPSSPHFSWLVLLCCFCCGYGNNEIREWEGKKETDWLYFYFAVIKKLLNVTQDCTRLKQCKVNVQLTLYVIFTTKFPLDCITIQFSYTVQLTRAVVVLQYMLFSHIVANLIYVKLEKWCTDFIGTCCNKLELKHFASTLIDSIAVSLAWCVSNDLIKSA